jgi:hypothetical protein
VKQEEEDDSTDDARKLELSDEIKALAPALHAGMTSNEREKQLMERCLDAIRQVEAYIASN